LKNFISTNLYYSNHITNKASSYLRSSTILLAVWLSLVSFGLKTHSFDSAVMSFVCSGLLISVGMIASVLALYEHQRTRDLLEHLIENQDTADPDDRLDAQEFFRGDRRRREFYSDVSLVCLGLSLLCFVWYALVSKFWENLSLEISVPTLFPPLIVVLAVGIIVTWGLVLRRHSKLQAPLRGGASTISTHPDACVVEQNEGSGQIAKSIEIA
jgi:hypothetical protein